MTNDPSSMRGPCDSCDLIREADHRIANHLALLASYVRLKANELAAQGERDDVATTQMVLGAVGVQLDLIAGLHRGFLNASPETAVQLPARLEQVCQTVRGGLARGVLTVDLPSSYPMAPSLVAPVTQAVAEALINAVKHGARPGEAPRIALRATRTPGGGLVIEIADRGPGLTGDARPTGSGMRLMRALCDQVGADLAFETRAEGLLVRMTLPDPPALRV